MDAPSQNQSESIIIIRFQGPNSTLLEVKYQNVSPLQALLAAYVLNESADASIKDAKELQKRQAELGKIVVPQGRSMP